MSNNRSLGFIVSPLGRAKEFHYEDFGRSFTLDSDETLVDWQTPNLGLGAVKILQTSNNFNPTTRDLILENIEGNDKGMVMKFGGSGLGGPANKFSGCSTNALDADWNSFWPLAEDCDVFVSQVVF